MAGDCQLTPETSAKASLHSRCTYPFRQHDVLLQQAFSYEAEQCLLIFESPRMAATAVVDTAPPSSRFLTFQPKVNEEAHLVLLHTRTLAHLILLNRSFRTKP
jgi:hypothetical protein